MEFFFLFVEIFCLILLLLYKSLRPVNLMILARCVFILKTSSRLSLLFVNILFEKLFIKCNAIASLSGFEFAPIIIACSCSLSLSLHIAILYPILEIYPVLLPIILLNHLLLEQLQQHYQKVVRHTHHIPVK